MCITFEGANTCTARDRARPRWVKVMEARRRKALVVREKCHDDIHAGAPAHARGGGRP
jgi:hypothetical protein